MNLILALFWLLLGITVLAWQMLGNPGLYFHVGGYPISYGWFMFLFVIYNLKRWWTLRKALSYRRKLQKKPAMRQREARSGEGQESPEPPNPAFNFTNPPLVPPATDAGDRPGAPR